jgi:hypothetical protein
VSTPDSSAVPVDSTADDDDYDDLEELGPDADETAEEEPEPESRRTPDEPSPS